MAMTTLHKKGYALALAMILVIVLTVSSVGLFKSIEYLTQESRVHEVYYTKGYFAVLAALRYGDILLQTPIDFFGGTPEPGDIKTVSLWNDYNDFAVDMGLDAFHDVSLQITVKESGEYEKRATYTY